MKLPLDGRTDAERVLAAQRRDRPIFQDDDGAFTMKEFISEDGTGWSRRSHDLRLALLEIRELIEIK